MGNCKSQAAVAASQPKKDFPTSSSSRSEKSINVKGVIGVKDPSEVDMDLVGKTLNNVLHDPICIEYFAIHLANEHSSENLDFYESVDHFRHEWDIDHINACKNIAVKIFQLYCATNAPLAVNLPSKIRNKCEALIRAKDFTRDIFDDAASEIYMVMNRDSFARFKMSPLWASYVAHPDRHPDGAPLADCYTGRRNSDSLMQFVGGEQDLEEVVSTDAGFQSFKKFLEVDSETEGNLVLSLFMSIRSFKDFISGLGIPRQEDMFEIEDHVKFLIDKHFKQAGGEGEELLPKSLLDELVNVQAVLDDQSHTVRQMCTVFNKMEAASLTYLRMNSFTRFVNSALYIKYRMTFIKTESMKNAQG